MPEPSASPRWAAGEVQYRFLVATTLDVAVMKPGNVSQAAPGHGMQARQFLDSAQAAAGPLCAVGVPVGERVEAAVRASWAAAGCNTNLGILLLCAPLAAAAERREPLAEAVPSVLAALRPADAEAVFRAIAHARPGGLGTEAAHDVRDPPRIGLLAAMAQAEARDRIAWQYTHGLADVLQLADGLLDDGFRPESGAPTEVQRRAVQACYLRCLQRWPDSHIVRKHGAAVAHSVLTAAQARQAPHDDIEQAAWAAWDRDLKRQGLNPGTSADLTVAALFAAGLQAGEGVGARCP